MNEAEWIQLVFPTVIGLSLVFIAHQQKSINSKKLKLDLYNKRFEIFKDVIKFYQELLDNQVSKETHKNFINSKESSYFLFSKEPNIYQRIDELHSASFKINWLDYFDKNTLSPTKIIELQATSSKAIELFHKSLPKLKEDMKKYLNQ